MTRSALVGLLVWVVLLGALPTAVCGGGGHGGGGHGGGGHCGGAHGGNGGARHGGSPHGVIGHGGHGTATCGFPGPCWGGAGNSTWDYYLARVDPTPGPEASAPGVPEASDADDGWDSVTSSAEEEAQYRYDHRAGGD